MPSIWKQVLAPGSYYVDGQIRNFSPALLEHFAKSGKAMIQDKLPIRVPEEHQQWADPLDDDARRAKETKYNRGFVTDYAIDRDKSLWSKLEVSDATHPNILKRLKEEIKFVSPRILPRFTDGAGKTWENIIGHVALTAQPVWHKQKPFGSNPLAPVAMSLSDQDFAPTFETAMDLSLADRVEKKDGKWQPVEMATPTGAKEQDWKTSAPPIRIPEDYGPARSAEDHGMAMTHGITVPTIPEHPKGRDATVSETSLFHHDMLHHHASMAKHHDANGNVEEAAGHRAAGEYHGEKLLAPLRNPNYKGPAYKINLSTPEPHPMMAHAGDVAKHTFPGSPWPVDTILDLPAGHWNPAKFHTDMHDHHVGEAIKCQDEAGKTENDTDKAAALYRASAHWAAATHHNNMFRKHLSVAQMSLDKPGETMKETPAEKETDERTEGEEEESNEKGIPEVAEHYKKAKQMLKDTYGVELPEHANEDTAWEHVCTALKNKKSGGSGRDDEGNERSQEEAEKRATEEPMVVSMSMINKLQKQLNDTSKKLDMSLKEIDRRNKADGRREFSQIKTRVDRLVEASPAMTARAEKWLNDLHSVQMSLGSNDGNPKVERIMGEIDTAEEMLKINREQAEREGLLVNRTGTDMSELAKAAEKPSWYFSGEKDSKAQQEVTNTMIAMANGQHK